ncbi:MAG TPA: DinB family protein, partial [Gemmatirosa sp.]
LLAKRLQRAREAGLGPETDARSRLDAFDVPALVNLPPFDAPESVVPATGVRADEAEAGLRTSREALDRVIADANGLALSEVRARHLRFGEIDFYQWLLFVAGHEQRHLRQLTALRDELGDGHADEPRDAPASRPPT